MPSNIYPKKKKKDPHVIHFSKILFNDSLGNLNTISLEIHTFCMSDSTQMQNKYVIRDSLKFANTDAVVLKFIVDKSRYHYTEKKRYSVLWIYV